MDNSNILEKYEIDRSLFEVGANNEEAEHIYSKPYKYWNTVFKKAFTNPTFLIVFILIVAFLIMSFTIAVGEPAVIPGSPPRTTEAPLFEHWFGTGKTGEDMWNKVWIGSRTIICSCNFYYSSFNWDFNWCNLRIL
nr:hypothetical protein [Entomoplasma sp. MP1]